MSELIGRDEIIGMILSAVEKIKANHEVLTQLDSAAGDGDHGITMLRSMQAVEDTINDSGGASKKDLLHSIGWAVMSADGGSTGPLLGSFFVGMSEAAVKDGLDCRAVAAMFEAGISKVHKQSRAEVGDRTMMDAMLPARDALKVSGNGASITEMLKAAADAAADGAEATKNMVAKFGRAKNLGQRVLGHADPGATSISLIFQAFYEGLCHKNQD